MVLFSQIADHTTGADIALRIDPLINTGTRMPWTQL